MRVLTHEVCPDYGPAQPCCRYCGTMAEYADAVAHRDCPDDAFAPLPEECPKCGTFVPLSLSAEWLASHDPALRLERHDFGDHSACPKGRAHLKVEEV